MRDTSQFRERFKKWKEGTPIKEIYDNGRPTYFESMELLAPPMAKNWTNIKGEFKPSAKYVGTSYSNGKDGDEDIVRIINKVNSSKANFVSRLKDPNRKFIQDWASDNIATHKLGVGTDEYGNHYIYPEVQEINGKLIDFTRPPYAPWVGQVAAEERGDTVRVPSIEEGIRFTENYKKYYPKGNTFSDGKDDRTYIGGSNQELVVTPGKSWTNPYTGEYTLATESYAQPIASKDPYVDYQFYSPTGNSIVLTINSTPRWQQYWADQEGARVAEAKKKAAPYVLDLLSTVDLVANAPEMIYGLYLLGKLGKNWFKTTKLGKKVYFSERYNNLYDKLEVFKNENELLWNLTNTEMNDLWHEMRGALSSIYQINQDAYYKIDNMLNRQKYNSPPYYVNSSTVGENAINHALSTMNITNPIDFINFINKSRKGIIYTDKIAALNAVNELFKHFGGSVDFDKGTVSFANGGLSTLNKIFNVGEYNIPYFGTTNNAIGKITTSGDTQHVFNLYDFVKTYNTPTSFSPLGREIPRIDPKVLSINTSDLNINIPSDYTNALRHDINYITLKFPGSKPFGSSVTSAYANVPHVTDDIDVIMTEKDFVKRFGFSPKNNLPSDWHYTSGGNATVKKGFLKEFGIPSDSKAGDIDFNILYEDNNGMATGDRAMELFKLFFPDEYFEQYKIARATNTPIKINKTPKELLDRYDPVTKTLMDALQSNKSKHVSRAHMHVMTADPELEIKALDQYIKYRTAGLGKLLDLTEDMFSNPSLNSKIFDELGYRGFNKQMFVNDPKRMEALIQYWYVHNGSFGRGVYTNALNGRPLEGAFRVWTGGEGGNAMGEGLNTVNLGDSGYGDIYGVILPKIKLSSTKNPIEFIHDVLKQIGYYNYKFSSLEKQQILELLKNYGITPYIDINTPSDLLNAVSFGSRAQSSTSSAISKKILQQLSDDLGIRALGSRQRFGSSRYTSMTGDIVDADALGYSPRDSYFESPVSDIIRDEQIGSFDSDIKTQDVIDYIQRAVSNRDQRKIQLLYRLRDNDIPLYLNSNDNLNRLIKFKLSKNKDFQKLTKRYSELNLQYNKLNDLKLVYTKNANKRMPRKVSDKVWSARGSIDGAKSAIPALAILSAIGIPIGLLYRNFSDRRAEYKKERMLRRMEKENKNELDSIDSSYVRGKDSGIYIKPSKRGTFTAAAKKRGMSVLSFASKVLNNPSNYSKAMRKKALFAKNASKFKH